tara:strand:+ start:5933 stop:6382 length:450 start_codon:yes stop_codon:yes gene_type:complete
MATTQILDSYKTLLNEKLNKKINNTAAEIIDFLHDNNNYECFLQKTYDILCALDIENNEYIYSLLNDMKSLNQASTFNMCPDINQSIYNEIKKRKNAETNTLKYYNTEFTCKKCKHNKTTIVFVNKHLGSDEASSLKITCVNCNNEWYS